MNSWPVIVRELRDQARQPNTYWLRVLSAGLVLGMAGLLGLKGLLRNGQGQEVLPWLHWVLFTSIWIVVPLMTADSLSRERREGTLGLLFLTPLKPRDIVMAKGLSSVLRGLTVLLTVAPVMALPILLGGVSWEALAAAAVFDFSALGLALAASLLASAHCVRWGHAAGTALLCSLGGCVLFSSALRLSAMFSSARPSILLWVTPLPHLTLGLAFNGDETWKGLLGEVGKTGNGTWFLAVTGCPLIISFMGVVLAHGLAGRSLRRHRQDSGPSPFFEWCRETFCVPIVWRSLLRRSMRRSLERNPVGWLEHRSWHRRVVGGGWLLAMSVLLSLLTVDSQLCYPDEMGFWMVVLGSLLAGSTALTAAASFHRERETGVMELLLISPLRERQIVGGRLRAIWAQFLPAGALLVTAFCWMESLFDWEQKEQLLQIAPGFVLLPVIGLYFSLRCRHVLGALLWTLAAGLLAPWLAAALVCPTSGGNTDTVRLPRALTVLGGQVLITLFLWRLTELDLRHRRFAYR
jgi:ABC-type transport system involved in multi-copper enzyme maturation permease subunit